MSSSSSMDLFVIDQEKLQREFDRIKSSNCKSLKEAFPSKFDQRVFPLMFKKAGLWKSSFKRTFGTLTPPKNRSEYKKRWAASHAQSVKKSREQYANKQREKAKKSTPPPCENVQVE